MSKFVDYTRLRTIDDVHAQRQRINRRLGRTTGYLADDAAQFRELFSLDHWLDLLGEKLATLNSTVSAAYSGVRLIFSLFRRK